MTYHEDRERALGYLASSMEALNVKLLNDPDWRRCKRLIGEITVFESASPHYWLPLLPYQEYLQTEHWAKARKTALERADFKCRVCNVGDTELHVHHRTYQRLGREREEDLIVLCKECHSLFHEHGKLAEHER
jgi:hypothetical protein